MCLIDLHPLPACQSQWNAVKNLPPTLDTSGDSVDLRRRRWTKGRGLEDSEQEQSSQQQQQQQTSKHLAATHCKEGTSSYIGNENPTSSPSSSRYLGVICPSPQVFHGELYWQLEMTVLLPGLVDCLQDPLQNKKLIASAGILNPYELPVQRWNTFR